ncbi:MAG: terpene cyclase/mutase family protein [Lentisphaeria bacterium]|nr:terpene cyclase/mutase family protein [Lentisphaeria bacterium]
MKRWRSFLRFVVLTALLAASSAVAQDLFGVLGDPVAAQVETVYSKGLKHLLSTQQKNGAWKDGYGRQPGVIGLAILAMLAHGEDPDFGPCSEAIRKGVEAILDQAKPTGYLGDSMYNHGFATLALAEVYGMVDDDRVGPALQKAVDLILNSQKRNPYGAWRYRPESKDADTTVSGACMVALFAARNAGVAIPQEAIDRGLQYFRSCATTGGGFGYNSPSSPNGPRSAIGALVFALAGHQEDDACKNSVNFLKARLGQTERSYYHYYLYYMAQAMFHNDMKAWRKWDSVNLKRLASSQQGDGSWKGSHGNTFCTSAALLSLALNYRFLPIYER